MTTNADDDPVVALAPPRRALRCYRGSEHDVLARYAGAAREVGAGLVVRVTSDCPLIDPVAVDAVIGALEERRATRDYASNRLVPHAARGAWTPRRCGATCWSGSTGSAPRRWLAST